MREDAVADLVGQVQRAGDAERLLVVPEATPEASFDRLVECVFSVAEGRVAHVVPEADRLDESSFRRRARPTTRLMAVVSRVCVIRVR